MKHIVAINGSPQKGRTLTLLENIAALLETQQISVTILNLGNFQISECTGCELCIRKTSVCYQEDGAQTILPQLLSADGVILASPVYMMNITGKLKSLIDKTASWVHRPPMVGKPVMCVATTAGAGLKDVLNYLEKVAVQWGAYPTDRIGRSIIHDKAITYAEVKNFVWHLNTPPALYTPSQYQLFQFQIQKALALHVLANDRVYWSKKGWDNQLYYFPARIPWHKRSITWVFHKFIDHQIRSSVASS